MSTSKYIDAVCIVILILTLLITVLFMNGEALGIEKIVDEDAEANSSTSFFTKNDRNGSWDPAGATRITLNGNRIGVSGGGAYAYNGNVMITSAGRFVVSGTLDDGSIVVDTDSTSKVWIMLDGAAITCSDGACIRVEQADKVFLTLAEGTENMLISEDISAAAAEQKIDGALFSRDDLTINGSGTLTVSSAAGHGIAGNDDLIIAGGNIEVKALRDGLHANEHLRIADAAIRVEAGDDGVAASGEAGDFYMESGSLNIVSTDNGLASLTTLDVAGGELKIDSGADGITADGAVRITGGSFSITAYDDGIHSDTAIAVSGGSVLIPKCYEGLEAVTIDITGGEIEIYPEDDGINANGDVGGFGHPGGMTGGGPESAPGGGFGGWPEDGGRPEQGNGTPPSIPEGAGQFGPPDGERPDRPEMPGNMEPGAGMQNTSAAADTWIRISGGSVTVINETARDADGLDSNGDIIISGGTVRVSLVNSGSNSALDCGSENGGILEISGGTINACGSYSMAEGFASSSTQCSLLYNFKRGAGAGTTVSLEDADGKVLLSWEVPCSYSSVAISCPEMKIGGTYIVAVGDFAEELTLKEVSASFGDVQSEGFDGSMNWGGMKFRDKR